jgi:hypothetical protein
MSIRDMIREWVRHGELCHIPPLSPSDSARRSLFCSAELWTAFRGPWESEEERKCIGHVLPALDAYVTGLRIMVRFPPSKNRKALLALLEDEEEEVWEFRCRDPSPQIRIFGRFADRDLFIAFTKKTKRECHTDDDYHQAKEECKRKWRSLFPSYNPYKGNRPDDYVSDCVLIRS